MSIIRSNNKKTKLYIKTTTSKFLNKTLALVKESKYEIETSGPRAPGPQAPSGAHQRPGSEEDGDTSRTSPFYNFTNPNVYLR